MLFYEALKFLRVHVDVHLPKGLQESMVPKLGVVLVQALYLRRNLLIDSSVVAGSHGDTISFPSVRPRRAAKMRLMKLSAPTGSFRMRGVSCSVHFVS